MNPPGQNHWRSRPMGWLGAALVALCAWLVLAQGACSENKATKKKPAATKKQQKCSGKPDAPCTQQAIQDYEKAKEQKRLALNAQAGGKKKKTFKKGPEGVLVVFQSLLGILLLIGLAWAFSSDRRAISWRPVAWGLGLQLAFACIVLNPVVGDTVFSGVDAGVRKLLSFAEAGTAFVLQGTDYHTVTHKPEGHWVVDQIMIGNVSPAVKTIAFWVLPTIIFFSALMTVLYHLGVMQWIVRGIARAMRYVMGTSGAETLSCTANIFVGQTEAPLLIKPFVKAMTHSELMAIMTGALPRWRGGFWPCT